MITDFLTFLPSPPRGVWYVGAIPIRAYALCIVAGILAALWLGDRRWAARGGERGVVYDVALWAVPFGLIGGRVYHLMTDWPEYFKAGGPGWAGMWRIWDGGLGIWGAVALGAVGAWIACRRRGIPLPAFGDAVAPGIILAQAIGRLGNYFNQELYGRETDVPWGLEIFNRGPNGCWGVQPFDGVSTGDVCAVVHPTFLYELLWNLLVFAVLLYVDRRYTIGHGRLFALYVAGYCVGRFGVELLRADHASMPIADIRVNSFTAAFVFIGAVVYMVLAPKGREDPATLGDSAAELADRTPEAAAGEAASAEPPTQDDHAEATEADAAEPEPEPEPTADDDSAADEVPEPETGTDTDDVGVDVAPPDDTAADEAESVESPTQDSGIEVTDNTDGAAAPDESEPAESAAEPAPDDDPAAGDALEPEAGDGADDTSSAVSDTGAPENTEVEVEVEAPPAPAGEDESVANPEPDPEPEPEPKSETEPESDDGHVPEGAVDPQVT